jgi:hypothetical protein
MKGLLKVCVLIPVLITMMIAVVFPLSAVDAQDGLRGAPPVPDRPHGIITDTTPTYRWTKIEGATSYQYQVWSGATKVLDRTPATSSCGWEFCSRTPDLELDYKAYKWRVRAMTGGIWSAWSAYMDFLVSPPSFYSSFNGSKAGWQAIGTSVWHTNDTTLYTYPEHAGDYSAIYNTNGMYTDFTYSASFKSKGLALLDQFLVFRAGTHINPVNGDWFPAYVFGITGEYMVGVFKIDETGDYFVIHNWDGLGPINTGYNTLKVTAKGDSFRCYLNGVLVVSFTDDDFPRGLVGLKAYKDFETNNAFIVDWAMMKVLTTPQ